MGLFDFRKKGDVIDLTARYRKQQEKASEMQNEVQETVPSSDTGGAFSFLGNMAASANQTNTTTETSSDDSSYLDASPNVNEKRKRLAKRFMDMTNKIEDLSNQIYHLQQRIEVLERKGGIS